MVLDSETVSVRCWDCTRGFYVTAEPATCPYCGSAEIEATTAVVIDPV